jgi:hypothetical protein
MSDSIQNRMIRAAKLDSELYEEVEADKSAMGQATTVVVLAAIAAGVGSLGQGGLFISAMSVLAALLGWYVWAYLTFFIGAKLVPEPQTEADHGELLRTLGFAAAPGLLRVFGVIPGIQGLVFLITGVWMLVAGIIAVRQALDYESTVRAVIVCGIGWLVQGILLGLVLALFL